MRKPRSAGDGLADFLESQLPWGLFGAWAMTGLIAGMLFDVSATDH